MKKIDKKTEAPNLNWFTFLSDKNLSDLIFFLISKSVVITTVIK